MLTYSRFGQVFTQTLTDCEFSLSHSIVDSGVGLFPSHCYVKNDGTILYAVSLQNYDQLGIDGIKRIKESNLGTFGVITADYHFRNVIIFNIIVAEKRDDELNRLIEGCEPFLEQNVYCVDIVVDLSEEKLFVDKEAPYKLAGVYAMAQNALQGNAAAESLKARARPSFVYVIIAINAIMMLVLESMGGSSDLNVLINYGALDTARVVGNLEFYRLFSSIFLHSGLAHFAFNTLSLYVFGSRIERFAGHWFFLGAYVMSGLMGSCAMLAFGTTPAVGASGAIFGLIGASIVFTYRTRMSMDGLNFYIMLLFATSGLILGLMVENVGNAAHIAGFLTGFVIAAFTRLSPVAHKAT